MMTPMARSTAFPRSANFLNSSNMQRSRVKDAEVSVVMPALVAGMTCCFLDAVKGVDGRANGVPADKDGGVPQPGHDEP
jgi:hypothetical protein